MLLVPIGDEPNDPDHTAWVNYALIVANVVAYFAAQGGKDEIAYQVFVDRWGSVPAAPTIATMFTSMFMHANLMHLGGNMLFLWIYGDNVEARLGRLGYLAAYLGAGLVGNVVDIAMRSGSTMPGLGASGAISGVMGLYVVAFPRNRVKFFFWIYWFWRTFLIPAWMVILVWFIIVQNVLPALASVETGVAHGAHLGGFGAGVVLMFLLKPLLAKVAPAPAYGPSKSGIPRAGGGFPGWRSEDRYAGGRTATQAWSSATTSEEEILSHWRAGRWQQAAERLCAALRDGEVPALPEGEFVRIAVWLYDRAHFEEARRAFKAFLATFPSSRNAPVASYALGMILSRKDGDREGARPYLLAAARGHPDPAVRDIAARELER